MVGAETRRFIGHLDVPLSPIGEAEAAALGRRLAGVKLAAVYSSDLARTRRTAEILAAPHGLGAVPLPELREFSMGRWEGLTAAEIRALDPTAFEPDAALSLPQGQVAIMGPEPAINAVYYNKIMELPESERAAYVREKREAYVQDVDIYKLASEMLVDGIIAGSELRGELIKRLEYAQSKQLEFPPRRNPVLPV